MSLAGKPTVLWFWAPWCPVCLGQAPGVREAVELVAFRGRLEADEVPDRVTAPRG